MHNYDDYYLVGLLNEQIVKKSAFNKQLALLSHPESSVDKQHRIEYMKFLADRLISIDAILERYLTALDLDLGWMVE
jgi:hypothetical protein